MSTQKECFQRLQACGGQLVKTNRALLDFGGQRQSPFELLDPSPVVANIDCSSTGRPISKQEVDGEVDSDVAGVDSEAAGESVIVFDIVNEVVI